MYSFTDIDIDDIDPSSAQKSLPPLSSMYGVLQIGCRFAIFSQLKYNQMCDAFHKLRFFHQSKTRAILYVEELDEKNIEQI